MELASWEPNMLIIDFQFDSVHCCPNLSEGFGDLSKQPALSPVKDNLFVHSCVQIDKFDILSNLKVDFFGI